MSKRNGNTLPHVRFRYLILFLLLFCGGAFAAGDVSNDYQLWKGTKFHRFFVRKGVAFSKYKKMAFLPMDYSSVVISPKTKKRLRSSWDGFIEEEMPNIASRFDDDVREQLADNDAFSATDKVADDTMIVTFKAEEITPKAAFDNGLSTVGKQTLTIVGYFRYQVVVLDSRTREIIAMIEDDHTIAPNSTTTGEQANNVGNHRRAWSMSMHGWTKRFFKEMAELKEKTPMK